MQNKLLLTEQQEQRITRKRRDRQTENRTRLGEGENEEFPDCRNFGPRRGNADDTQAHSETGGKERQSEYRQGLFLFDYFFFIFEIFNQLGVSDPEFVVYQKMAE